jgi:SAM-dependent methyltransferase
MTSIDRSKVVASRCPNCYAQGMQVFYKVERVPVHSVLLLDTREEAINYPKGTIALGFCANCGFISNVAFDPTLHEYSSRYEETQGFSPTFNAFHRALADRLITRYDLHDKDIIEIGCGKGEFLTLLCEMGNNRGVGFDPAYISERNTSSAKDRMTFIKDFYSEKYTSYQGDFVCCKMTLEHIPDTAEFVSMVRRSIGDRSDTTVFFQIPDTVRILEDLGFWDIYYEHCSYFSPGSLARLFQQCGFDVTDIWTDYGDQYLMIEARRGHGSIAPGLLPENELEALTRQVNSFTQRYDQLQARWKTYMQDIKQRGQRAVLWGSGSKGVAFLTTLGIWDEIEYTVDINPHKHNMYMAGTGQRIVAPDFLRDYQPDVVIIMNPVYRQEIQRDLQQMGLAPKLVTVEEFSPPAA